MFIKKLKLWFVQNWLMFVIALIVLICFIFPIFFLTTMPKETRDWILGINIGSMPIYIIQTMIFVGFLYWLHYGGASKLRKTNVKIEKQTAVRFTDVIGLDQAKKEAWEVVQLLKDRARVKKIGGKIIKGILMIGPPGCGKTMVAKAIAREAGIPFLAASGSEFIEVFVGVGASRVRKLFRDARLHAEAYGGTIIFIDELDVIGRQRITHDAFGGGQELNSTINQLLTAMDGIDPTVNVVVMGATNVAEGALDSALLRPGRFDRKIYVGKPNLKERNDLFGYYLKKIQYDASIDISRLARKSVYKTPAEIENIVKESALIAARNKKDIVDIKDISEAIDRIELGIAHKLSMTPQERERVAFHEAGHLVALYLHHPTNEVFKATIVSRGGSLGAVHQQPREELFTQNRDELFANVKVSLAGYVSEKMRFNNTSSGVSHDFSSAMAIAHDMVWRFGMGTNSLFGDFTIIPATQFSENLKEKLNHETQQILESSLKEVEVLLKTEWNIVERFAKELIDREELEYDEIASIFSEYNKHPRYTA
ncbi:AAA family ATPase [Elusimicrobiota bacterium]